MDISRLTRKAECEWHLPATGAMRVPGVIYADEALIRAMDEKVPEQVANVAALPGIVKASFAMPDAHWGYGFPIGGGAAFEPGAGRCAFSGGGGLNFPRGVVPAQTALPVVRVRDAQGAPA